MEKYFQFIGDELSIFFTDRVIVIHTDEQSNVHIVDQNHFRPPQKRRNVTAIIHEEYNATDRSQQPCEVFLILLIYAITRRLSSLPSRNATIDGESDAAV
jgi:hypothetical protein